MGKWENMLVSLKNDEAIKIVLLNIDPLVHTYSILHMTKWEINIKHFRSTPKHDDCLV